MLALVKPRRVAKPKKSMKLPSRRKFCTFNDMKIDVKCSLSYRARIYVRFGRFSAFRDIESRFDLNYFTIEKDFVDQQHKTKLSQPPSRKYK